MDKRLGRNILYGLSMLAFCGLLLYGARFDRAPSVSIRERGSANAAVLEELEAAKAPEPDELKGRTVRSEGYEEIALD